jgi:hypothetical protein
VDGGKQLKLVRTPTRRLVEVGIGVDDPDDLDRVASQLVRLDLPVKQDRTALTTQEPVSGARAVVQIAPRLDQPTIPTTPYNGPRPHAPCAW